ncbi:hypothetical protein K3495_g16188 [Podosphaera aphanis]|nr:hypothetical protein K3495_g16188 [Podosphaera aphanis]
MASVAEKEFFKTKYGMITVLTTSTFAEWYDVAGKEVQRLEGENE